MGLNGMLKSFEAPDYFDCCTRCGLVARHRDASDCIDGLRSWIAHLPDRTLLRMPPIASIKPSTQRRVHRASASR